MKIKIKSFNGELPSYLTVGKVYDVCIDDIYKEIVDDKGIDRTVFIRECSHLNGGSWEVVND